VLTHERRTAITRTRIQLSFQRRSPRRRVRV
jgi:hypothetical protein